MTTPTVPLTFTQCEPMPRPPVLAIEVTEENIGALIDHINANSTEACLRAHDGGKTAYWQRGEEAFEVGRVLLFNTDFGWLRVTRWDDITGPYILGDTVTLPNV